MKLLIKNLLSQWVNIHTYICTCPSHLGMCDDVTLEHRHVMLADLERMLLYIYI